MDCCCMSEGTVVNHQSILLPGDLTHTHLQRRRVWRAVPSRWGDGWRQRGWGPEVDSGTPA